MAQLFRKNVRMFQNGGVAEAAPEAQAPGQEAMGAPAGTPQVSQPGAAQGGGDPVQQLKAMADEAIQTKNADLAFQVCEIVSQVLDQQGGGQGAPMSAARGGVLRRINGRATRMFQ